MDWVQILIMAVVEGVTEFLPISSTAHLVLTAQLLNIAQTPFVKSFEIAIQLGAIGAVVVLNFEKLIKSTKLIKLIAVAFVPTGILGFGLYKIVKEYLLGWGSLSAVMLVVGGVGMIVYEKLKNSKTQKLETNSNENKKLTDLSYKQAAMIGLGQSVSMIPGVSRALATIFSGMAVGLSRPEATSFSFLLAIPTMAAATGYDLLKTGVNFSSSEWGILGMGIAGSFVSALIVVKWLIGYVKNHDFAWFGWYRIAVGLLWIILLREIPGA